MSIPLNARFNVLIETDPATRRIFSGATSEPDQLRAVLNDLAQMGNLAWWARQPPAPRRLEQIAEAVNQGRWPDLPGLAGRGAFVVRWADGVAVYGLGDILRAQAMAMRTRWWDVRVACCVSTAGRLGLEVVVTDSEGRRTELAVTGDLEGPMGRFRDVLLDDDANGAVTEWLDALGVEALFEESSRSA